MNAKNILRAFALLLVAVMAIGVFAACAPAEKPAATTAAPNPNVTTTADPIPEKLELHILVANDSSNIDFNDREQYNVWKPFAEWCAAKKLTITWEIVEKDQYQAALVGYMAGPASEMPDAFWCDEGRLSTASRTQLVDNGRLVALEDILPYSDGTARAWYEAHPLFQAAKQYKGKTYWVGSYQEVYWHGEAQPNGGGAVKGITIRLDWYDKLVELGKWDEAKGMPNTMEEIGEFLQACNDNDMNGNGERDEYYLNYIADFAKTGLGNLMGIPRAHFAPNLVTGEVTVAWTHKNAKEFMELLIDWNEKGFFPDDMVGGSSGSTKYRTRNQTAVYNAYFCDNWSMVNTEVQEGAKPAVLIGVLPDKTVHPDAYLANDSAPTMDNVSLCFTSNLSHPAAAAALLDIITDAKYAELMEYGTLTTDDLGKDSVTGSYFIDADGKKVHTTIGADLSNAKNTFITFGANVFGYYVLPTVGQVYNLESDELLCLGPDGAFDPTGRMHEVFVEGMSWPKTYPDQIGGYLATPTAEEAMALTIYEPIFEELSKELFYSLITGETPMSEWDDVIEQLKDEGYMDEIAEIYQARFSRYLSAYQG